MTLENEEGKPKPPVILHMRLERSTIRAVDMYAAEHDLYRNEAAAELIKLGIEAEKGKETE